MAHVQSTATVETLTAEVRVLMVGSRQVTLSVAKQLDAVPIQDMEPFGRVHLSDGVGTVIGRHNGTGALVTATFNYDIERAVFISTYGRYLPAKMVMCSALDSNSTTYRVDFRGRELVIAKDATVTCGKSSHTRYGSERCDGWNPNGCEVELIAAIYAHDDLAERYKSAAILPLIVLAGLK